MSPKPKKEMNNDISITHLDSEPGSPKESKKLLFDNNNYFRKLQRIENTQSRPKSKGENLEEGVNFQEKAYDILNRYETNDLIKLQNWC